MKAKPIVLGCSIAFVFILLVCGIGGFVLYRTFIKPMIACHLEKPAILGNPGIIQGAEIFDKSVFVSDSQLGAITDIRLGRFLPGQGEVLAAVSSKGTVFFDRNGDSVHRTMFSCRAYHVDLIDIGATNGYAFLNRGSWGIDPCLINSDGNESWKYGGLPGVDDMCAGDVNGDGALEFAVGFNGGGGIHLLNYKGERLWREDGATVWHVEITDVTGTGTMRIVHSDAGGSMTVRDAQGSIVQQSRPGPYFSHFSLCPWPTLTNRTYALLSENETIWLFDYDGSVTAQYQAPDCGQLGHARGTPAKLEPMTANYLAVIVDFSNWDSSIFYVYDHSGNLIFKEVIPESCPAITALKHDQTGTDMILVGGAGKIWSYRMTEKRTQLQDHPTNTSTAQ